jgi:hypothetical protein
MFTLLKKTPADDSREGQLKDLDSMPAQIRELAAAGLDCDALPEGTGEFGRAITNPIPVNGGIGELIYLCRLTCKCGRRIMFHRLSHAWPPGPQEDTTRLRDIYETVCPCGAHWDILFLHPYHPRRSVLCPKGYTFGDYHPVYSKIPLAIGTDALDQSFPFGLRKHMESFLTFRLGSNRGASAEKDMAITLVRTLIERYEADISDGSKFARTPEHMRNLEAVVKEFFTR